MGNICRIRRWISVASECRFERLSIGEAMFVATVLAATLLGGAQEAHPDSAVGRAQTALVEGRLAYVNCVETAAGRLEASREPASVVADAALESCSKQRQGLIEALTEFSYVKLGIDRESSRRSSTQLVNEDMRAAMRSKAILVVTERRAARGR